MRLLRNFYPFCKRHTHLQANYCTNAIWPRQVLSAIQPTGKMHLGNYLGAVKKWVDLQNSENNAVIFGIADLHSITIPQNSKALQSNILATGATLLACGIDPEKSILFQQSSIVLHSQLCWILSTMATMNRLSHLPQYKEKSKLFKDIPVGIFLYPILQASDIMSEVFENGMGIICRATHVPVGEDQIQHLQLTNHLIRLFNSQFGETFPQIEPLIDSSVGRIKSLVDPSKKMSKSDANTKSAINLVDSPEEILMKCKKALSDFKSEVTFEPENRPGISNLLLIHSAVTGKTIDKIVQECTGIKTAKYKILLAEILVEHLKPIRKKIMELLDSPEYVVKVLEIGTRKANEIGEKTLKDVNHKIGFDLLGDAQVKTLNFAQTSI